jgi:hypothetical protein
MAMSTRTKAKNKTLPKIILTLRDELKPVRDVERRVAQLVLAILVVAEKVKPAQVRAAQALVRKWIKPGLKSCDQRTAARARAKAEAAGEAEVRRG